MKVEGNFLSNFLLVVWALFSELLLILLPRDTYISGFVSGSIILTSVATIVAMFVWKRKQDRSS